MKILQLRFQNLNSLTGEWHIDFTDPAYSADGIFAITGPTGAGKTTILDAICLAIYGRTPRLERITQSDNQILSRQTGECFAEVTFATNSGTYRCHWSQHCAGRKPDGKLQNPKHEIADADSGRILESKLRDVQQRVETVTGMNFDQFTRAMLLAQGSFAAFLQASPDQRAPILEQITGTDIYSRISMHIHQCSREQRLILEDLSKQLSGIQLLSDDELAELKQQQQTHQQQLAVLQPKIEHNRNARQWLERLDTLGQQLGNIEQEQQKLAQRQQAFIPEQQRLDAAERAQNLIAAYSELSSERRNQQQAQTALEQANETLPIQQKALDNASKKVEQATTHLAAQQKTYDDIQPTLQQVRLLDQQISDAAEPLAQSQAQLSAQRTKLQQQQTDAGQNNTALDTLDKQQQTLTAQLESSAHDADLNQQLAAIRQQINHYQAGQKPHTTQAEKVAHCAQQQRQAAIAVAQSEQAWQSAKDTQQQAEQHLAAQHEQHQKLLDGHTLNHWREQGEQTREHIHALERLQENLAQHDQANQARQRIHASLAELAQQQQTLEAAQQQYRDARDHWKKQIRLLEPLVGFRQAFDNLSDLRSALKDGEPCPLCGSEHHPYHDDSNPIASDIEQRLSDAQQQHAAAEQQFNDSRIDLAKLIEKHSQHKQQLDEQQQRLSDLQQHIAERLSDIKTTLDHDDPQLTAQVMALLDEQQRNLADISTRIRQGEHSEQSLQQAQEALSKAQASVQQAHSVHQQAQSTQSQCANNHQREQALLVQYQQAQQHTLLELKDLLQPYGVRIENDSAQLAPVLDDLEQRSQQWQNRQRQLQATREQYAKAEQRAQYLNEQITELSQALQRQQSNHDEQQSTQQRRINKRQALLGNEQPDSKEQQLKQNIQHARQALDSAKDSAQQLQRDVHNLQQRIDELRSAITQRSEHITHLEADFLEQCQTQQFSDEAAFLAAQLPYEVRQQLSTQAKALHDEQLRLNTKEQEVRTALEQEREKALTSASREALSSEQQELEAAQSTAQQQLGAIDQQLKTNQQRQASHAEQLARISAQQRECTRWENLNGLIGSADGKKYRNFAQGLTFDIMIGHANLELGKMTDRYLLIRSDDPEEQLVLNVIDNYQAGEIRATRNLSGGESFIISLALALGLSQMASQKVRIDALFLDEGFGTLDEDALDIALDTLSNLNQQGKLIGIISHVGALKERISTQIRVTPTSSGRSKLTGPGCHKIADAR
ncbi:AAA family ATPase [Cardiobacteriaceae bacterium TAE3-ERU3]|nr:AAA family ATPase [Cardiobacteriaceae bacterium TAE3-ERU3]